MNGEGKMSKERLTQGLTEHISSLNPVKFEDVFGTENKTSKERLTQGLTEHISSLNPVKLEDVFGTFTVTVDK
jgi:ribosome biogenesis protein Nip4